MSETDEAVDQDAMADEWAAALEEQGAPEGEESAGEAAAPTDAAIEAPAEANNAATERVATAPIEELQSEPGGTHGAGADLDSILDIPVSLSVEIGRTKLDIRNLLQLNQGSVVELDRLAGEPLDVMVNGTLVARGEVVVMNEKFGIRLTDVVSAHERVNRLR